MLEALTLENIKDIAEVASALSAIGLVPMIGKRARAMYNRLGKLDTIEHELTTNSGQSLKDLVMRMTRTVGDMSDDLAMTRLMTRSLASNERRIPMFECNASGSQLWVNDAWTMLTGLSLEEMLGWGWVTAVYEPDRERVVTEWENAIIQKRLFIGRFRYQHVVTREITEVQCRANVVLSAAGRPLGWVGAAIPVKKETTT
jgi:PAS domain S-box-containing protein